MKISLIGKIPTKDGQIISEKTRHVLEGGEERISDYEELREEEEINRLVCFVLMISISS